jgi:hypothetical protein
VWLSFALVGLVSSSPLHKDLISRPAWQEGAFAH